MLSPAPGNSDMIANQRSNPLPFAAVLIGLTVMSVVALPSCSWAPLHRTDPRADWLRERRVRPPAR